MNLGQSIRNGVKWLAMGRIGGRVLEFAFGIILARLLVPADFGMVVTVSALTGFVGLIASGGMGQALVRAKAVDEHDFDAVFTLQLALGVVIYGGFFLAAPAIADFFHDPLYADLIRVSAVTFLLRPFLNMRSSWLNREMRFRETTVLGFISGVTGGVLSCLMAWIGFGVWSLVLSGIAGSLLYSLLLSRVTPLRLRLRVDLRRLNRHTGYGAKITINDILGYLIQETRNLLVSKLAGPAFLGLFNKGESLSRLPNQLLMQATMQPLFRAMAKTQDDLDKTKYLFHRAITLLAAYTLPLYVALWWIAEPFIRFVYGEKWVAAAEVMQILLGMGIFLVILGPCGTLLDAQNRLTQEMVVLVARLGVTLGAIYIGLDWGLSGVAWALLLVTGLTALVYYALAYRVIRTSLRDLLHALAPGLALVVVMFAVLALLDTILGGDVRQRPAIYLMAMAGTAAATYVAAFLYLPIPALNTEAQRWRQAVGAGLQFVLRPKT
jgi:O-antigen/teichoic acid export membrane protein